MMSHYDQERIGPQLSPAMKIKLSRHARRQMKWREIAEEEIKMAIKNPDRWENTTRDRKNAFKIIKDRSLKVTYKPEDGDVIVITAMVKGA
jgi:hypothetical protein